MSLAGRSRTIRTPHGVATVRTSGASGSVIGRLLQHDQGIDRDDARRRRDDRVEVDLEDVGPRDAETPERRPASPRSAARSAAGPAADAVEDARAAQVVEHRHRDPRRDRRQADRDVVEHLGEDPAEPDQDDRAELRVAPEADDQLDPGLRHRLHEEPADVEAAPAAAVEQVPSAAA